VAPLGLDAEKTTKARKTYVRRKPGTPVTVYRVNYCPNCKCNIRAVELGMNYKE